MRLPRLIGVILGGALVIAALGLLDLSLGLLAVAAAIGWVAGDVGRQPLVAGAAAAAAVALGLVLRWAWSLTEGGVLGPVPYVAERYGPLAVALVVVAGTVGAVRAR